jgi:hypothetical protein
VEFSRLCLHNTQRKFETIDGVSIEQGRYNKYLAAREYVQCLLVEYEDMIRLRPNATKFKKEKFMGFKNVCEKVLAEATRVKSVTLFMADMLR